MVGFVVVIVGGLGGGCEGDYDEEVGKGEDGVAVLRRDVEHGLPKEGHGRVLVLGGEEVEVCG